MKSALLQWDWEKRVSHMLEDKEMYAGPGVVYVWQNILVDAFKRNKKWNRLISYRLIRARAVTTELPLECSHALCSVLCRFDESLVWILPDWVQRLCARVAERWHRLLLLLSGGQRLGLWVQKPPDAALLSTQHRHIHSRPTRCTARCMIYLKSTLCAIILYWFYASDIMCAIALCGN